MASNRESPPQWQRDHLSRVSREQRAPGITKITILTHFPGSYSLTYLSDLTGRFMAGPTLTHTQELKPHRI